MVGALLALGGAAWHGPPLPAQAQAQNAEPLQALLGQWRFAGGEQERAKWARAIEGTAGDLNIFVRPFARSRLRSTNRIADRIQISADDGLVTVQMAGATYRAPLDDGWVHAEGTDGTPLHLLHRMRGNRLVQVFVADEGRRTNVLVPRPGGSSLQLWVEVRSPHFETPLTYTLTYVRE